MKFHHGSWIIAVLAASLLVSGLVCGFDSGQEQGSEAEAVKALQSLASNKGGPSESELQRLESRFPSTRTAGLARFTRGALRYHAGDFAAAASLLAHPVIREKTQVGDHALFLAATAHSQLKEVSEAESTLAQLIERYPGSIYLREACLTAAQLATDRNAVDAAVGYLRRLLDAKDPGGVWQTGQLLERKGETSRALGLYQELYFDSPPSREALEAETRLVAAGVLSETGSRVPATRLHKRFESLYQAGAHADAVQFYDRFLAKDPATVKDEALVLHYGRSLYEIPSVKAAIVVLGALKPTAPEVEAERLYWIAESYARSGQAAAFVETSQTLVKRFPQSPWAAASLYSRARHYSREGGDVPAVRAFKQLVRLHPQSEFAPEATYQIGRRAYFKREYREASDFLVDHIGRYVNSDYYGPCLYWAGRAAERDGRRDEAIAIFDRVLQRYRYTFYGQMAMERLEKMRDGKRNAGSSKPKLDPGLVEALMKVKPAQPRAETLNKDAMVHLEKARELQLVRAADLALKELEESFRLAPGSRAVSLEMARLYRDRGDYRTAITMLQRAHPEYTLYQGGEVPHEVEEILFPMAFWKTIQEESKKNGLDPYFVAGLIRQESAFDPNAKSRANARGLMQLIPSTGRVVARRHGLGRISSAQLYQPELNIRLGTSFLGNLVNQLGRIEYATAAYNGGPTRTVRWRRDLPYREIDEWVENIPIRETRLYVQAVLRNAAHYRRIYGSKGNSKS